MVLGSTGFPQALQRQQLSILPATPAWSATPCQPETSQRKASTSIRAVSTGSVAEPPAPSPVKLPEPSGKKNKVTRVSRELDLKQIPGVGPKYAQLLTAAGLPDVQAVNRWFRQECSQDVATFVQQLQGRVGIKHKLHRERIAAYLSGLEFEEELPSSVRKFVTVSVEGNISAGKSTFLKGITMHCPDLQDLLHVVPEPVDRWQNVGNHNLLDKFYHDKERYAYTFQNYIFFTRMMQEQDSARAMTSQPYRLLERSIFCDRMVFVESLKDSNILSEMELSIYDSWFDPVVEMAPTLVPDGFIYLRATPQTCMSRLKHRARDEETAVDISYLEDLHQRHDAWLYQMHENADPGLAPLLKQERKLNRMRPELIKAGELLQRAQSSLSAPTVPDLIKADVKVLNKEVNGRLHHSIHRLPALVLDCEKDIHDLDAQKEHADKVNAYFEYVKDMRKHRAQLGALEGLATTQSGNKGEVFQRFNAAKKLLDPEWVPEVESAFHRAMAEELHINGHRQPHLAGL